MAPRGLRAAPLRVVALLVSLVSATVGAVGLATAVGPPLAWYDPKWGEIGDICNGQEIAISLVGRTFIVQREFSNLANDCVVP